MLKNQDRGLQGLFSLNLCVEAACKKNKG